MTEPQAGTTTKERSNMVKARIAARLTKKDVAKKLQVDIKTVINWEKAYRTPHLYQLEELCKVLNFNGTDEELLHVFTVGEPIETGNASTPKEPVKERTNMIKARRSLYLSQKELAKLLKVNITSVLNWEKGHTTPQLYQIPELKAALKFTGTDEELLEVFTVEHPVEEPIEDIEVTPLARTPSPTVAKKQSSHPHKRSLLQEERESRGWTRAKVEALTEAVVTIPTLERWEKGLSWPRQDGLFAICKLYGKTPQELGLVKEDNTVDMTDAVPVPPPCERDATSDTLDSSDSHMSDILESEGDFDMDKGRRNLNTTIAAGIFAAVTPAPLVSSTQIITTPLVEADAYLDVCRTSIGTWWNWYNTGNDLELERALNKNVPVLKRIATTVLPLQTTISPIQKEAASLAVQVMVMQIGIATANMQFLQREKYCHDAVQLAEISGDKNLLALTQFWYGDTFTYCYNEPQIALQHLNDALKNVSSVDGNPLTAIQIYSDLCIAHAQNHDKKKALNCIELAYSTMPSNPELDNRLYCVGHAELDQKVGKAYLYLAEYLPSEYAKKAYAAFDKSTGKQATHNGYRIQALTRKADASRLLGRKDECVESLTECLSLIPSTHKLTQIQDVLHRVPEKWQKETAVKNLHKDISHALVVARR